ARVGIGCARTCAPASDRLRIGDELRMRAARSGGIGRGTGGVRKDAFDGRRRGTPLGGAREIVRAAPGVRLDVEVSLVLARERLQQSAERDVLVYVREVAGVESVAVADGLAPSADAPRAGSPRLASAARPRGLACRCFGGRATPCLERALPCGPCAARALARLTVGTSRAVAGPHGSPLRRARRGSARCFGTRCCARAAGRRRGRPMTSVRSVMCSVRFVDWGAIAPGPPLRTGLVSGCRGT